MGLVSRVVQGGREEVVREALEVARVIAGKSPIAVAGAKHLIGHSRDHTCVGLVVFLPSLLRMFVI